MHHFLGNRFEERKRLVVKLEVKLVVKIAVKIVVKLVVKLVAKLVRAAQTPNSALIAP
jgi:hypothetical protein